jgi:hypothetical protein
MNKIANTTVALNSSSNRVALLLGLHSGNISLPELEQAILQDTAPRQYRKPVVFQNRRFDSVTDAAHYIYRVQPDLRSLRKGTQGSEHAIINRLIKRISRLATQDATEGCYWSE